MIYNLLQPHTIEIYNLKSHDFVVEEVKAKSLLVSERFDLFAKLYYADNRKKNYVKARDVYNSHIKAFNPDLKEPGRNDKNGYDDFIKAFNRLLDYFEKYDFDASCSIVPVDENGIILDGAHRIAALAYYGKCVTIARFRGVHSKAKFDFEYFLKRGLNWQVADIIALEMTKWRPNMLIACLWPKMGNSQAKREALAMLERKYPIRYKKTVQTNFESFVRLISKVYEAQTWVGNKDNNFAGARDKALNCYDSNRQIVLVLFDATNFEEVVAFKEQIRRKFKCDKHSIHITDNVEETKDIAEVVFDAEKMAKWNTLSNNLYLIIRECIHEKTYYFRHVTWIKWKGILAKMIGYEK